MNNILKQIYTNVEATNKSVVSTNATLEKLLKLETAEFKRDEKSKKDKDRTRRREKQAAARKAGDGNSLLGKLSNKEKKKEKKSIMDMLMGALSGIGSSIMGILGSIGSVIGTALTSAFAGLGLGALLTKGLLVLGPAILAALKFGLIGAGVSALVKTGSSAGAAVARARGGTNKTKGGVGFDTQDVADAHSRFLNGRNATYLTGDDMRRSQEYERILTAQREGKQANDRLASINERIEELEKEPEKNEEELKKLEEDKKKEEKEKKRQYDLASQLFSDILESDEILIQNQIDKGRRDINNLPKGYTKDQFTERPLGTGLGSQWEFNTYGDEEVVQKQKGGLIPTLLEPGEKVFLPGQWGSDIAALNDAIPRFQTGGVIEHYHGDPNRPGYDAAGHGSPTNAHDHYAFSSAELRKIVQAELAAGGGASGRKWQIGSTTGGRHAPNSYHYSGQAFDIPWSQFGSGQVGENDFRQSKQLADDIKSILRKNGHNDSWPGGGDGKSGDMGHDGSGKADAGNDKNTGFNGLSLEKLGPLGGVMAGIGEGLAELAGGMDIAGMIGGAMSGAMGAGSGIMGMFMGATGGGNDQATNNTDTVTGEADGDMVAGAKLIMEAGFPKKGAAYLAGNIQQESSWNGQRDWGEVMGDGSLRNGGLVSWMNNASGHSRLTKIENYLGKKIQEASDGEQIGAMIWEMKKRNPSAYQTFMNPEATEEQLINASKAYWGYGHEGPRYQYAKQTLQKLQKGGMVGGVGHMGAPDPVELQRLFEATVSHNDALVSLAQAEPIVVFEDEPAPSVTHNSQPNQDPPSLPNGPSSTQAAEYFYNLNSTGSF